MVELSRRRPARNGHRLRGSVQSVARALRALEFVAASRDGVTAKELAAHLDIALPSTYHVLTMIEAKATWCISSQEHRYGLGPGARCVYRGWRRARGPAADRRGDQAAAWRPTRRRTTRRVPRHRRRGRARGRLRPAAAGADPLDIGFHEATHATAFAAR